MVLVTKIIQISSVFMLGVILGIWICIAKAEQIYKSVKKKYDNKS